MKNTFPRLLQVSIIILAVLAALLPSGSVYATEASTSVTITLLDVDGKTVLQQQTVIFQYMRDNMPVLGGAEGTPCWTQSISNDPADLWDTDENNNLKYKGILRGTDLKDLCNLVGGMKEGDLVQMIGSDNVPGPKIPYQNVYHPDTRQGPMGICWYNADPDEGSPGYVPTYQKGMLLAFFPSVPNAEGKMVFGNWDMHECLSESCWTYNGLYPSANGLYTKWVSNITIYSSAIPEWSLALSGELNYTMYQSEFEHAQGINCHGSTTFTDDSGLWSGLPLWMLTACVDDAVHVHGEGCYNHILANAGYDVNVIGSYGSYTFKSQDIARKSTFLLADKLNGSALPDGQYPLKLVGAGLTGAAQSIGRIERIELLNVPDIPQWDLELSGGQYSFTIWQVLFEQALSCHGPQGQPWTYSDGADTWSGMPLWYFCGWVDDNNDHGSGSFNDALAMEGNGYSVKVIGSDGEFALFNSKAIARSSHYLVANMKNGQALDTDQYPLVLAGSAVSAENEVWGVSRIEVAFNPAWDLNCDHVCDVGDIAMIGQEWGNTGSAGWIAQDLNKDGAINVCDVVLLGRHWGQTW